MKNSTEKEEYPTARIIGIILLSAPLFSSAIILLLFADLLEVVVIGLLLILGTILFFLGKFERLKTRKVDQVDAGTSEQDQ